MPEHPTSGITRALAARGAALLRVRWFVRAPIWLYRTRLGFLFGSRMLMLEHIGRRSGMRRYVVLEIIAHPTGDSYVVASGFGTQAQWFRNVRANPQVRLYLGSRKPATATARILQDDEAATTLISYAAGHPRAWRALELVVESTLGARIGDEARTLPLVAIRLRDDSCLRIDGFGRWHCSLQEKSRTILTIGPATPCCVVIVAEAVWGPVA